MKNIIDMIELKKNLSNEAERILDNAEGGVLNKAQKIEFDNLLGRVKELSAEIDCEAVRLENKPYMDKAIKFPPGGIYRPAPKNPSSKKYSGIFYGADDTALNNGGFDSLEDFLKTVHSGRADERLVQCSMVEGVPDLGGFSVPEEFAAFILDRSLETEIVRPRAAVFPMQSQTRKAPAFDNSDRSESLFGGFTGQWLTEGETAEKHECKLRLLTLTAKKLACFTQASNELLADGVGFEEQLGGAMIKSVGWFMDYAFINGSGVDQPLGILNDPALITVGKESDQPAGTITYGNVVAMFSRLSPSCFNGAIWIANPTVIPQLLTMSMTIGEGGVHIPVFREESGRFTILGKQVVFTEKCPPLGKKGDLMLADLTQYAIGIRKEISLDRSNVPGWTEDMTDYRVIVRLDGKGMWDKPVVPKNGHALSWCVVLENRA